jgi:hypothetical protein
MMKLAEHVERMGVKRNKCEILEEKPEGRRLSERPRHSWNDNIKIDFRGIG